MTSSTTITTNPASTTPNTNTAAAAASRHQQHLPLGARPSQSAGGGSPRGSGTGGGGGGGGGGTNQACAACKYQRRKCNPDCPMAPYFPADQQRRFLNAHRLFGVSNILKTLRHLKPELCDDAMRTLIYQAEMRAHDPVGGCYRVIFDLERQLEYDTAELSTVLHHLALCRQAAAAGASASVAAAALPACVIDDSCADLAVTSSNQPRLLVSTEHEVVDALYVTIQDTNMAIFQPDSQHNQTQSPQENGQQQLYDYFYYDSTAGDDASSKPTLDINVDGIQNFDFDTSSDDIDHKANLTPGPIPAGVDEHSQIDQKEYETKSAPSLVGMFDMREVQPVDMNAGIDVKEMVDVNADMDIKAMVDVNAGIDIKAVVDVNADIGVKKELPEEEEGKMAVGEVVQMAESTHCKLGLGFSSF